MSGAWATDLLTTVALLVYFVALDATVGGAIIALNARRRWTLDHRRLAGAILRALPWTGLALAAAGSASLVLLRARYGASAGEVAMLPGLAAPAAGSRLAHLLLAACAVAGVLVAQAGRSLGAAESSRWVTRHGAIWAMFCTMANLLVGVLWMSALPRGEALRFTGADTGVMMTFAVALVAAILALGFVAMSLTVTDPRRYLDGGTVMLVVTLAGMVRMREALRPDAVAAPPDRVAAGIVVLLLSVAVWALVRARAAFAGAWFGSDGRP
jgi:hypothetical protein